MYKRKSWKQEKIYRRENRLRERGEVKGEIKERRRGEGN